MNVPIRLLVLIPFAAAPLVGCRASEQWSPPTAVKIENVSRVQLDDEFTPGREIIVAQVEMPPNTRLPEHWHPGEEFHIYMEGEVEIVIEGHPSISGIPGVVGHVPYAAVHTAITRDKGAKVLVFRVHSAGEPVRYLEESGSADR